MKNISKFQYIKFIVFTSVLFLFFSCTNEKSEEIEGLELQVLPDNVENVGLIKSDNENLQTFLSIADIDNSILNLNEVSVIKFKGNGGKFAFLIPYDKSVNDNKVSKTLIAYFKNNDFTKTNLIIYKLESNESLNEKTVVFSDYKESWFIKKHFKDEKLLFSKRNINELNSKSSDACIPPSFAQIDTNGDGLASEEELNFALNYTGIVLNFLEGDSNGDGFLSYEEYSSLVPGCIAFCTSCLDNICSNDPDCHLNCMLSGSLCFAAYLATCTYQCWW